ncbi:phosphoribosyltransferase domain-containing protein [Salinarimonas ramus]|uniref:Phosphoribosyltransferase n=1 Tax=Salinarimonas ramus TaxID=690164 RepID=A0A917Q453_9HYPH|nr:phosphoribosyltransferase domain-containing protein [Salinarimonas ramus]GGK19918.1 phosphoribosyltransferase [Salinarimonas ramus]
MRLEARLTTGTIAVEVARAAYDPHALFGFAERRNPKRAFLFVSKVLGRHVPVAPAIMRATTRDLAAGIPADLPGPVLVVGMAETAIALGAGVHQDYVRRTGRDDAVYLATTRHPLGSPLWLTFEEEHSHATRHLIHEPTDERIAALAHGAKSLVLVDDEASTGRTFANLAAAFRRAGLAPERIVMVTLTDWSAGRAAEAIGARNVTLLEGAYRYEPLEGAPAPEMPAVDVTARGAHSPDPTRDWGRLGVLDHRPARIEAVAPRPGERILVLGTGEFVFPPFLLAEALEAAGADVRFSAVTRSPIAIGHAVETALAFGDNYGLGIPNFLYNVTRAPYDRVLVCVETGRAALDPALVAALDAEILEDGEIRA